MTTFDRLMQDPQFKDEFEKGYNEFLISEFMIEKNGRGEYFSKGIGKRSKSFSYYHPEPSQWKCRKCKI